jgi:DNA-binding response OmpR family regulator
VATGVNEPVVLVVDDEPAIRFLCKVNLELDGYRVVEAGNLGDARLLIELEPVALVLLDVHLGLERGGALLEELRHREPPIPVVMVTGSPEVEAGERPTDADAVLGKPFTIDELLSTVQGLVGAAASR